MPKEYKKIYTPVFQAAFTQRIFEAGAMEAGQTPKFGLTAIWTPARFSAEEKELWRIMFRELDQICEEAFGCKWKELPANLKRGIRNGNEKPDLDGFGAGTWFASLTTTQMPTIINARTQQPIAPEFNNASEIYAGCFMDATVSIYSYKNKGSGVALGFRSGRKVGDGKRLDASGNAAEDFKNRPIPADMMDAHEPAADDDEIPF